MGQSRKVQLASGIDRIKSWSAHHGVSFQLDMCEVGDYVPHAHVRCGDVRAALVPIGRWDFRVFIETDQFPDQTLIAVCTHHELQRIPAIAKGYETPFDLAFDGRVHGARRQALCPCVSAPRTWAGHNIPGLPRGERRSMR